MNTVNKSTANWRLLGGGGLALGGFLYALAYLLGKDSDNDIWFWLSVIGIAVAGVAFFYVAYGETGSNGAVGASSTGKLSLYVTAGAFLLYALLLTLAHQDSTIDSSIFDILQLATIVALAWSAYEISKKGVAKGNAALALFVVAAWSAFIQLMDWADNLDWWQFFILGLTLLGTGILYVLND